jgi:putative SOS response-associated peptidase YedK
MCGRFTQRYTWREIHGLYGLTGADRNLQAYYNVAPTDTVDVARSADGGATELVPMRWGLIPSSLIQLTRGRLSNSAGSPS